MSRHASPLSKREVKLAWLLFAVALRSLGACGDGAAARDERQGPEATAAAPPVHVQRVQRTELTPWAEGTAEIEALRDATLRAETAGRVVGLYFDRGEQVKAGKLLLKLDVGRTTAALEAGRTAVQQAQAQLAQAEREHATAERLAAQGSLAQQALDNARDAERIARAALENAKAQIMLTRRGLTEAAMHAPFDGTIVERLVELGEYLAPATPVARLVDSRKLRARVPLDPARALDIKVEARVQARAHARPGEVFHGTVLRVGEVVDPMTRKLPVEVELQDPDARLRPGLVARLRVETGPPRAVLTVDENAVFERFRQSFVFVVKDGKAIRREVELGEVRDGRIEVMRGVEAGEEVVSAGIDRVAAGAAVTVVTHEEKKEGEGAAAKPQASPP